MLTTPTPGGTPFDYLKNRLDSWYSAASGHGPQLVGESVALSDAINVITLESGGNPYAVFDNTQGANYGSHDFTTYQSAADFINTNPTDQLDIGLFQLETPGGVGAAYASNPTALLNPDTNIAAALPTLMGNVNRLGSLAPSASTVFDTYLGNAWYSDRGKQSQLTTQNINATLQKMGLPPTDAGLATTTVLNNGSGSITNNGGATQPTSYADELTQWLANMFTFNNLLIVAGVIGILLLLVNMSKGSEA